MSPSTTAGTRTGIGLLVLAGVLWGTGGLTGTLLAREADLPAAAVAAYRLGLGGLVLLGFAVATRRPWPRTWRPVVLRGLLAAVFQAAYFAAVARTAVSLATLVAIGSAPVFVLLAGRRRPTARSLAATTAAVLGLTLLVGVPGGAADPAGVLFALLAGATFATMTVTGRTGPAPTVTAAAPAPSSASVPPSAPAPSSAPAPLSAPTRIPVGDEIMTTGLAFVLGSLVLLPVAGPGLALTPTPAALALIALLGLGPTAIGYAAYFRGLRHAQPGTAALMALLEPLIGTVLAVLVLGDRLGPVAVAGAVLLIVALAVEATRVPSTP